ASPDGGDRVAKATASPRGRVLRKPESKLGPDGQRSDRRPAQWVTRQRAGKPDDHQDTPAGFRAGPERRSGICPWEVFLASAGTGNRVPARAVDEEGEVGRGRSNCLRRGGEGPNSGVMKGAWRHDATGDGARVGAGREPQAVAAWEQQRAITRASDGPT